MVPGGGEAVSGRGDVACGGGAGGGLSLTAGVGGGGAVTLGGGTFAAAAGELTATCVTLG